MSMKLTRRQLLWGATAAGLLAPFTRLGGSRLARAAATPADKAKVKAMFVYVPDGCIPSKFHPTINGSSYTLAPMTEPLFGVKKHLTFLKGLDMYSGGATHEGGIRKVLTGVGPVSLDVFLGKELNAVDKLAHPSIQLGVAVNFENGSGGMSFIGEGQEVKPDDDPINAFTRIFGAAPGTGGGGGTPAADPAKVRRKSILDLASADIARTRSKLGSVEKEKLDVHVESFREVEARLNLTPPAGCGPGFFDLGGYANNPADSYPKTYHKEANFQRVTELQMDIAAMALSCRMTRVTSLMLSHPVSPTHLGAQVSTIGNHDASHFGNPDSTTAAEYIKIKRWFMDRISYLVNKLSTTPDPDGGMLIDNVVVFVCSELGDSNNHDHRNMPFFLAGHAAGQLAGDRAYDFSGQANGQNQPHTKLLTSIANMLLPNPINEFGFTGMGTGPLAGLA